MLSKDIINKNSNSFSDSEHIKKEKIDKEGLHLNIKNNRTICQLVNNDMTNQQSLDGNSSKKDPINRFVHYFY